MPFIRAGRAAGLGFAAMLALSTTVAAQTLTIGVRAGQDSMDPHFTATGTHAEAMKHVFDTLTWSGDQLQVEPGLAESWRLIDPTTWEFKLRRGVKFHDGSDFTAEDVKFSIERIPMVSGPNPTTIYVRRVKETRIIDPHTVHIVTDGPAPSLPYDFIRLFIVSHKAAAGLTKETANEVFNSGKAAIGTGPFRYVSWTPREQTVLERNDAYWRGPSAWQRVVRREIPNDAARVAQLKAGQVDMIVRVPASDVPTLQRDAKLSVVVADTVYVFNAEFDLREKTNQVTAKDGSALAANPFRALPGCRPGYRYALGEFPPLPLVKPLPANHLGHREQLVVDGVTHWHVGQPWQKCQAQHLREIGELDGAEWRRFVRWRDKGFPPTYVPDASPDDRPMTLVHCCWRS